MPTARLHLLRAAGLSVALLLGAPAATAGPLSLLAKAAKVAGKAGTKGKSVATAGKLAAGGLAAERALTAFRVIPDDPARFAAVVTREGDSFAVMTRTDEAFQPSGSSWADAVNDLHQQAPDGRQLDLYLDPDAARHPPPVQLEGINLYVLDAGGSPHPLQRTQDSWEVKDLAQDLTEFVAEQSLEVYAEEEAEEAAASEDSESLEGVLMGALGLGLAFFVYREWKKPITITDEPS